MAHRPRILVSLFLIALLVDASVARAQFLDLSGGGSNRRAKVETTINTTALRAGGDGVLAVVVDIGPAYHAQSAKPLDENLIAFAVTPDKNPAVEFKAPVYPPGK